MKKVRIYGNSVESELSPIQLHRKLVEVSGRNRQLKKIDISEIKKDYKIDVSWLKSASKVYHINPNINDYICVPIPIVTSDIPNRNSQGFSLKTLSEFNSTFHQPRYKTFVGAPTFVEHQHSDPTTAKGVCLDAFLTMLPKYNIAKVVVLAAFDRTKDPYLVNSILKKERRFYSMGALAASFVCSICGGILGPSVQRTCTCFARDYENLRTYGDVIKGRLAYLLAQEYNFIELSSVVNPADINAGGNPELYI